MVNGEIDKEPTKLRPGARPDRFGCVYGSSLAPAGDRYAARALPPQNLNTRDAAAPCDYHVYKVTKPFWVWEGSIAPWFEQPGGGRQIKLDPVFLNPSEGQRLNVKWLLEHGCLAAVQPLAPGQQLRRRSRLVRRTRAAGTERHVRAHSGR